MSHRDISEVEPEGTSALAASSRALFLETVRKSNAACQNGDYALAATLYTEALSLDPLSHVLYSNRSAARLKMGHFALALQDAVRATELLPQWPKAYYRQGVALQCLGRHGEALVAFATGLAHEPSNLQLLSGLVEASLKSPLRQTLEPTFRQLRAMKLDESPFVVISVVGQELLGGGQYKAAAAALEAALAIGTCSLKLRGSVYSALSSAYWALNLLDEAISYMLKDLDVAKSLNDINGECRAHGNLGSAYFCKGTYNEALTSHRYQLVLAMKCKDAQAAASALTSLGHVYTAIGDLPNALNAHKQCVQLVKQIGDLSLQEAREIGNVGAVYLAMGEFESAIDCHTQHLKIAKRLGNRVEEARAFSNLGSLHYYRRNFIQAMTYHENVLKISQELGDKVIETRAYAGLGHAARCAGNLGQAKLWHQRQLDVALTTKDKIAEGRACSNLGIVYQLRGEHDAALKLHQAHLDIARSLGDRAGMGKAFGNIGNAYNAMGFYEQAIKYHKQELTISKEVNDRSSEASTHGNLAVAYQAVQGHETALKHYKAHLAIARELKDAAGEACALLNLANCLSSRGKFEEAVPNYCTYLQLSQELHDVEGEAKACHFLGYAHYCLGHYREAVRYYDQDLALAKDLQDKSGMGRAYCNLGLAHMALNNLDTALECQKYYLAIAHMMKHVAGKFRALGNISDCLLRLGETDEAIKMNQRQLNLARQSADRSLEAAAYSSLGIAHRTKRNLDKALGFHTQELTLRQEIFDLRGECRAHGNLGAVHMDLAQYTHAIKCYQEQLDRARELNDSSVEAQALGNLGIAKLNMSQSLGMRKYEVVKLRHRLGLVHWQAGEHNLGIEQLEKAANLLESLDDSTITSNLDSSGKKVNLLLEIYENLQKILVNINRSEEALNWAERSRKPRTNNHDDTTHYSEIIDRQRGIILYYSEVGNELYSWCLTPTRGLLRFHSTLLDDKISLENQVIQARECLLGESSELIDETTKIPKRGNHLNASSYSLSSLFSVGSASSRAGSIRWGRTNKGLIWQAPNSIQRLYDLLLAPFEDLLPPARKELILVVGKSLYLAPLPALQAGLGEDYLCERFSLIVVPSLAALKKRLQKPMPEGGATVAALVAGNPCLPEEFREKNGWPETASSAETEAGIVAEILESRPLTAIEATRSAVLELIPDAECIHLTTPIIWKSLPSFAFTPDQNDEEPTDSDRASYLISCSDIMRVKLSARLVVLSSGHCWSDNNNQGLSNMTPDAIHNLVVNGLLNSGAQAVLVSMWPVPSTAGSILLRAFYSAMLQGARASRALAEAMQTVQHTRHFAHPANWAGWLLFGGDSRLSNKVALMGQALAEMLRGGREQSRDALRVTLHLVEKSLQRIHRGQKNTMYTTQRSIENKVGSATGWKELLMSVGFRFEPAGNGIPSSVFFPQTDPEERLTRCSASLQAFLGLGQQSLNALVRLLQAPEVGEDVIATMRKASSATEGQEITLPVHVWRASGSHELFKSLGFDLMEVGQSEVIIRTGKQASRRAVQFALQALLALFDTQEAPKSLSFDSGSSVESLISVNQSEKTSLKDRPRLGGAFASYVRHRGEPDGKTTEPSSALMPRSSYSNEAGESDAAFTPSPPVALNLNHQTRIRNLYQDQVIRPHSSSDSSVTDWENGHNTILRRQPVPPTFLERLSVRTEIGNNIPIKLRQLTNNEKINNSELSQNNSDTMPHIRNITTSLTGLTKELTPTISDVYHERNLGLGLAPSLSKLLEEVGNVTESEHRQLSRSETSQTQNWLQNEPELCRRDEADGRSIAESHCSATSSNKEHNKIHRKAPPPSM